MAKRADNTNPAPEAEKDVLNLNPDEETENKDPAESGGEPPAPEAEKDGGDDDGQPKFSKGQLLKSNWYSHRRDVLTAILEEGKTYSHAEVGKLIEKFMKGKVK